MDNQVTVAQRNRAIKKALVEIYGSKNVGLHGSRGTAYGWINIKVTMPKPAHECSGEYRCSICRDLSRAEENKIEQIARDIVKKIGSWIGTYSSDDGYGTQYENMHTEVIFI